MKPACKIGGDPLVIVGESVNLFHYNHYIITGFDSGNQFSGLRAQSSLKRVAARRSLIDLIAYDKAETDSAKLVLGFAQSELASINRFGKLEHPLKVFIILQTVDLV